MRTAQKRDLQGVEGKMKDWPGEARAESGQSLSGCAHSCKSGYTRPSSRWPAEMF